MGNDVTMSFWEWWRGVLCIPLIMITYLLLHGAFLSYIFIHQWTHENVIHLELAGGFGWNWAYPKMRDTPKLQFEMDTNYINDYYYDYSDWLVHLQTNPNIYHCVNYIIHIPHYTPFWKDPIEIPFNSHNLRVFPHVCCLNPTLFIISQHLWVSSVQFPLKIDMNRWFTPTIYSTWKITRKKNPIPLRSNNGPTCVMSSSTKPWFLGGAENMNWGRK